MINHFQKVVDLYPDERVAIYPLTLTLYPPQTIRLLHDPYSLFKMKLSIFTMTLVFAENFNSESETNVIDGVQVAVCDSCLLTEALKENLIITKEMHAIFEDLKFF